MTMHYTNPRLPYLILLLLYMMGLFLSAFEYQIRAGDRYRQEGHADEDEGKNGCVVG